MAKLPGAEPGDHRCAMDQFVWMAVSPGLCSVTGLTWTGIAGLMQNFLHVNHTSIKWFKKSDDHRKPGEGTGWMKIVVVGLLNLYLLI